MKKLAISTLTLAFLASLAGAAMAKGGTPQTHHCVKDGAALPDKTKKECKTAGGTWAKDADAAKPAVDKPATAKPTADKPAAAAK
jgi:hypothetical protein